MLHIFDVINFFIALIAQYFALHLVSSNCSLDTLWELHPQRLIEAGLRRSSGICLKCQNFLATFVNSHTLKRNVILYYGAGKIILLNVFNCFAYY